MLKVLLYALYTSVVTEKFLKNNVRIIYSCRSMQTRLQGLPLLEVHSCTFVEADGCLFKETSTILYAIGVPEMNACKA